MNLNRHAPIAIAWITGICLLGDSMLYIVLPVYGLQQYGLDSFWQIGLLLSVNRLVRLPLGPLLGWLYARMPVRVGITAAVAAANLTTLAFGAGSGFPLLLAARALWGAAWSLLRIGGYLIILGASASEGGGNRGRLLGRYNGIMGIGSLVGMLAGGLLAAPLPLPLWLLALLGVMLAGTAITTLTDAVAADAAASRSAVAFMTAYTVSVDVGAALGPLAAALLLPTLGPDGLSAACSVCLLLLTVAWLVFGRQR